MSDTPRTDCAWKPDGGDGYPTVDVDLARQLERELTASNDRIKRLEEAGDALCENSNPSRWDSLEAAALKLTEQSNWNKAKEANP